VLHPLTVMVLLCAGVLIIGATLRSFADSYTVTASVQAPLPKKAAVIMHPLTLLHVSTDAVTVQGSCPDQSYVEVTNGTQLSGVSQCTDQTFQVQTSLSSGANQIDAQVYSLTDEAGPTGTPVTVYYDQTTPTPVSTVTNTVPPTTPVESAIVTMGVSSVDTSGIKSGSTITTSTNPTVIGWAPPWSIVTVLFHSDPLTCTTQADAKGQWTCTLDQTLPAGVHHVYVSATTTTGTTLNFPMFQITASTSVPSLLQKSNDTPMHIQADYHYRVYVGSQAVTLALGLNGGTAPYSVDTNWGDGTTTTMTPTNPGSFSTSHSYAASTNADKNYTILVHVTDARGFSSYVQLSAVVRGAGIALVPNTSTFDQYVANIQHWLWLIWPTYAVVVLMAIGYYLGEREEYQHLMQKKRMRTAGKTR